MCYTVYAKSGPALSRAVSDWKHFCGAPLNGLCRNILRGHQVIIIEIMSYGERVRSEYGNAKLEVSEAYPQVHFCSGDFPCPFHEHFRNTQ